MKTIPQLIRQLKSRVQAHGLEDILDLALLFETYQDKDWQAFLSEPKTTTLFQDEQMRLMLIYWAGFQKSKKHGHPQGGGLMKLLSGTLLETRFDPLCPEQVIGKHRYFKEDISYIHDEIAYHIVENPSPEPAVSLHLYSPGVYASKIIPPDSRGLEWGAAA